MEDEFEMPTDDKTPITPTVRTAEDVSLKDSTTGGDKLITQKKVISTNENKTDTRGKYKNSELDLHDSEDAAQLGAAQLRFGPQDNTSTWSLESSTASSRNHSRRWYRHPKVREHWKVVVISFVLFFIGLCLCITGIVLKALQVNLGGLFMFFVIGVICFIPGVYHVIAVYYAVKGKRGFSFYNLPLFN